MIILLIIFIYLSPLFYAVLRVYLSPDVPFIGHINPNSLSSYQIYKLAEKNRHDELANAVEKTRIWRKEANKWIDS